MLTPESLAVSAVFRACEWCHAVRGIRVLCRSPRYGIKVLLDIHALAGSQNGFDNSGQVGRCCCCSVKYFNFVLA